MPSVRLVQVHHENTIESPQLPILEKFVGFPVTCSDVTYTALAPAPVIERVLVDACAAPARLAPAPVTEFIAQARAAPSYPQFFYWFGESAIFYS